MSPLYHIILILLKLWTLIDLSSMSFIPEE